MAAAFNEADDAAGASNGKEEVAACGQGALRCETEWIASSVSLSISSGEKSGGKSADPPIPWPVSKDSGAADGEGSVVGATLAEGASNGKEEVVANGKEEVAADGREEEGRLMFQNFYF